MAKFDFGSVERAFEALWPVTVQVPVDGGKTEDQEFTVKFRLLSDEEFEAAQQDPEPAKALMRRAVSEIVDAGEAVTAELLEKLLSRGYVRLALNKAYGQFSMGIAAKN